jgi:sorting nexin-29
MINLLYGQKLKMTINYAREFDTTEGDRQGDTLACLLFNIRLEKVVKSAEVENRGTIFNKKVQILAYTNDIVIIGRSLAVVKKFH